MVPGIKFCREYCPLVGPWTIPPSSRPVPTLRAPPASGSRRVGRRRHRAMPARTGEDEQAGRDAGRPEDDQPRIGPVDAEDAPAQQFAEDEQPRALGDARGAVGPVRRPDRGRDLQQEGDCQGRARPGGGLPMTSARCRGMAPTLPTRPSRSYVPDDGGCSGSLSSGTSTRRSGRVTLPSIAPNGRAWP